MTPKVEHMIGELSLDLSYKKNCQSSMVVPQGFLLLVVSVKHVS
jgi:hypothetical protein